MIREKVLNRIFKKGEGYTFTPASFADIANPQVIAVILGRLSKEKKIQRITRGIYSFPKTHPKFGQLFPKVNEIVEAIAKKDNLRIMASGAYAANLLGLSEQVPSKIVFLTDGKSRKIKIGVNTIELKKASPKQFSLSDSEAGIVIQALRYFGKNNIDKTIVKKLKEKLSSKTKTILLKNIALAPGWMRPFINEISLKEEL
jgi:hypothetical protein